ncbi:31830_t:CDS:2, partial [Racocetra persica]
ITNWLENQYDYQIYRHPPKIKAQASFSKCRIPNKLHQYDLLPHIHDNQKREKIYLHTLVLIDVATRYKCAVALTSKTSSEVWNVIEKIYNDPKNPLKWPALLMVDGAGEFKGSFAKGMERYNVSIRVVNLYSFESLALVKKFKQDLARLIYKIQYAIEEKLKEGMSPSYAVTLGEVIPKVFTKPKRLIRKDEPLLQKRLTVRYLLKPGELEGGHMHKKTDTHSVNTLGINAPNNASNSDITEKVEKVHIYQEKNSRSPLPPIYTEPKSLEDKMVNDFLDSKSLSNSISNKQILENMLDGDNSTPGDSRRLIFSIDETSSANITSEISYGIEIERR